MSIALILILLVFDRITFVLRCAIKVETLDLVELRLVLVKALSSQIGTQNKIPF